MFLLIYEKIVIEFYSHGRIFVRGENFVVLLYFGTVFSIGYSKTSEVVKFLAAI